MAAIALAAPSGRPLQAQQAIPVDRSFEIPHRLVVDGVPNFAEVTPYLYRAGQPTPLGFARLAAMGINLVVDVRGNRKGERDRVTALGMQYVALPWHCPFPRDAVFADFLALLRRNPGKKVFIHCRLGDDRVGMMVAAYRMAEQGWTAARAKAEMRAFGFAPLHHLICPGLSAYASRFPYRYRTSPAFQALRLQPPPHSHGQR